MTPDETRLLRKTAAWTIAFFLAVAVISWPLGLFSRVANPDQVVVSYEQFFDRCAAVQSLETQRDELSAQLDAEDDPDEQRRLRSALTAVRSQRARTINTYNAEAAMVTRQWFRSERLPARLHTDEDHTTCVL